MARQCGPPRCRLPGRRRLNAGSSRIPLPHLFQLGGQHLRAMTNKGGKPAWRALRFRVDISVPILGPIRRTCACYAVHSLFLSIGAGGKLRESRMTIAPYARALQRGFSNSLIKSLIAGNWPMAIFWKRERLTPLRRQPGCGRHVWRGRAPGRRGGAVQTPCRRASSSRRCRSRS